SFHRTVDAHRNIRRLLVDRDAHAAGLGIEADGRAGIADFAHRLARELWNIDVRFGGHFARDVDLPGNGKRLDRDAGVGILFEQRIEHRVGNLIRELVGMPFGYRLAGEEALVRHLTFPRSTMRRTLFAPASSYRFPRPSWPA